MTTLLQVNTSIFSDNGQSTQLSQFFVAEWQFKNPDGRLVSRDLADGSIPHLDLARFQAYATPAAERTGEQNNWVAESDTLIGEIQAADIIVFGVPMYNLGVPSTLKAYFDHIARAGVTFRYTENGVEGLLKNKKAYVIATRGGLYAGTPLDGQSDFIRHFLHLIGIDQVEFIYAEGLNKTGYKDIGLASAKQRITELLG